ncbi:exodeoxyribonuclease III [Pontibacter silvestris]|uniref:Exodeoxyribonuclease III n=1 Tax=Pontibacter silvestris TaxID=2305183 RepID=A0ABW4X319_9BACT|nr:exodeoxyribonuclease III [Pontibacter silvestris]MCC9135678.1 exodeoxyribonuclease III [Pontibacter silvestris]
MKIITYNVNGIRAAITKGFTEWLQAANPDVLCLQEIKADETKFDRTIFEDLGYHVYLHPAIKKGYSGVAILSKQKPNHVEVGCGIESYDNEGRVLRADYDNFSVMSVYMPSGSSGDERQAFKMQWLDDFYNYINNLKETLPGLVVSGDYNICHQAIDIHNPKSNANNSGFLPEERSWMSKFIESGFIDSFRHFNKEPHNYSWWSYRAGARNKNLGWRIDYNMATENLSDRLKRAAILTEAKHSDHCPVLLEIE